MHNQPSAGGPGLPERDDAAVVVLDILIGQDPGLLHLDELVRLYAGGAVELESTRVIVADALAELLANGLVHRLNGFVLVSRTARQLAS